MPKINGGYYIKARKIQDSSIAKSPPHFREIWDWLLKVANHRDVKTYGVVILRGQVFTNYAEIQEDLSWKVGFVKKMYKKHHVDNAMAWLRQEQMITTRKTTRGLIITICNYAFYQDPANYEYATESDNEATRERQHTSTIHKNDNNNKNKEEYNRGTGDLASPEPPPNVEAVFRAPDGSLVKVAAIQYSTNDFNGLPEKYSTSILNSINSIKQIDIEKERLDVAWESFKTLEIHKKVYRSKEDVYSFFSNYCKKQSWSKTKEDKPAAQKPTKKDVRGVEFTNDFTECKMNDGTVKKLSINQQDSARYNHINPNSITK